MKFRVTGTLGDGSKIDKVVDAPDQKTACSYAEQNGVKIQSVSPYQSSAPVDNHRPADAPAKFTKPNMYVDTLTTVIAIIGLIGLGVSGVILLSSLNHKDIYLAILSLVFCTGSIGMLIVSAVRFIGLSIVRNSKVP